MKINKIHINAFGKLNNFDLSFEDGLNVIYGDNEFGKTTLMAFIKMIFFGTATGKAGADRKKYDPWSKGKYAGSIDFTKDGVPFRIEREFALTNSHDKIKLINLSTGTIKEISPKEELGEKLFGCSLACFERTLFIGSLADDTTENTVLGEINKKLSNIVSSGDETVAVDKVNSRLLDAKHRFLSKGGKIGICDKAKIHLEELKNTLLEEKQSYTEKEESLKRLDEIKALISDLKVQEKELKAQIERGAEIEKLSTIKEYVSYFESLKVLKSKLILEDGSYLNENHVIVLRQLCADINRIKTSLLQKDSVSNQSTPFSDEELNAVNEKITAVFAKKTELEKEISEKESIVFGAKNTSKTKPIFASVLLGCLAAVFAILGVVLGEKFAIPLFIGATLWLVLLFVLQIAASKKAQKLSLKVREEILEDKATLNKINDELNLLDKKKQYLLELSKGSQQRKKEISELKTELAKTKEQLEQLFLALPKTSGLTYEEKIENLSNLLKDFASLESKVSVLKDAAGGLSFEEAEKVVSSIAEANESVADINELKSNLETLQKRIENQNEEFYRLENAISVKYHKLHVPAILEREIDELQTEISAQENYCNCIDVALQVLEEASDEMQSSWGGELNDNVAKIFSQITGEKYTDVLVSKTLGVLAEENNSFGLKSVESLSAGTKDQSYLALRLALCDLIFGNDSAYPVFLDDSFERYDDSRAKRAVDFLKEFSKTKQVILFTCHKNILDKEV